MGRRRSLVPITEWHTAFSYISKLIARGARLAAERDPQTFNMPNGVNLARWAIARALLPKLREVLAEKPGIENAEEVKRIALDILLSLDPRKVAEQYLYAKPAYAEKVNVDQLAKAIAETLDAIRMLVGSSAPATAVAA